MFWTCFTNKEKLVENVKNKSGFGYCNHENNEFKILREENWTNCRRKRLNLRADFGLFRDLLNRISW